MPSPRTPKKKRQSITVYDLEDQFSLADNSSDAFSFAGPRRHEAYAPTSVALGSNNDNANTNLRYEFATTSRNPSTIDVTRKLSKKSDGRATSRRSSRRNSRQPAERSAEKRVQRRTSSMRKDETFSKPQKNSGGQLVGAFKVMEGSADDLSLASTMAPPSVNEHGQPMVLSATLVDDASKKTPLPFREPRAELVEEDLEGGHRQHYDPYAGHYDPYAGRYPSGSHHSPAPIVEAKPIKKRNWLCIWLLVLAIVLLMAAGISLTVFFVNSRQSSTPTTIFVGSGGGGDSISDDETNGFADDDSDSGDPLEVINDDDANSGAGGDDLDATTYEPTPAPASVPTTAIVDQTPAPTPAVTVGTPVPTSGNIKHSPAPTSNAVASNTSTPTNTEGGSSTPAPTNTGVGPSTPAPTNADVEPNTPAPTGTVVGSKTPAPTTAGPTDAPTPGPTASPTSAAPTKLNSPTMNPTVRTPSPTASPTVATPAPTHKTSSPTARPTTRSPTPEPTDATPGPTTPNPTTLPPTPAPTTLAPTASPPTDETAPDSSIYKWEKVGQDLTMTAGSDFGSSVSLSGNGVVLAAGSPKNGVLNVYELQSGSWSLRENIVARGTRTDFGTTVDLSYDGGRMATANPYLNDVKPGVGRILNWRNGVYRQLGGAGAEKRIHGEIIGENGEVLVAETDSNEFAYDVAMTPDGSAMALGARRTCLVRVVQVLPQEWKDMPPVGCYGDSDFSFGWSVDLDATGTTLVVGSPEPGDFDYGGAADNLTPAGKGRAHVFRLSGGSWELLGKPLVGRDLEDRFGWTVSVSDNGRVVAMGAPGSGSAHVYQWNDNTSDWEEKGSGLPGATSEGMSVSLSPDGETIAVGTGLDARTFRYTNGDWQQIGETLSSPHGVATETGVVVDLLEGRLVVGFPAQSTTSNGVVQVYDLSFEKEV